MLQISQLEDLVKNMFKKISHLHLKAFFVWNFHLNLSKPFSNCIYLFMLIEKRENLWNDEKFFIQLSINQIFIICEILLQILFPTQNQIIIMENVLRTQLNMNSKNFRKLNCFARKKQKFNLKSFFNENWIESQIWNFTKTLPSISFPKGVFALQCSSFVFATFHAVWHVMWEMWSY